MRSDILNANSNAYAWASGENLVKIKSKSVRHGDAATTIASGAISVPAGSIITRLTCIVESALAHASGNVGVRAGTAAAVTQFTGTLDADCLEASATATAAGDGTSTDDVLTASLGGTAILGTLAASYRSSDTDVHFRTVASTGAFTAGTMCYIVEYIELQRQ